MDLPDLLGPYDLVVVNETKVRAARLHGRREPTGGRVELLLLERVGERRQLGTSRPPSPTSNGTSIRTTAPIWSDHPVYDTKGDQEIFGTVPRWALLRLPTAENWKESSPDAGDIRSACLTSLWRSKPSSVEWASAVSLPHGSL